MTGSSDSKCMSLSRTTIKFNNCVPFCGPFYFKTIGLEYYDPFAIDIWCEKVFAISMGQIQSKFTNSPLVVH